MSAKASYNTYYYGIKRCDDDGREDTCTIEGGELDTLNTILVYPKKVEGTKQEQGAIEDDEE